MNQGSGEVVNKSAYVGEKLTEFITRLDAAIDLLVDLYAELNELLQEEYGTTKE